MIKTGVWTGSRSVGVVPFFTVGSIAVFLLSTLILGRGIPNPMEMFLWYSILFAGALLSVIVSRRFLKKQDFIQPGDFIKPVLVGLIVAFIVYLSGFWTRDIASLPLDIAGMAKFIVSLGVFPFQAGPDGLLRGFAWGVSLFFAYNAYQEKRDVLSGVVGGIVTCLVMLLVFLIPSIVVLLTFLFGGLVYTGENIAEFAGLSLNSYWQAGQIVRWFTGFGGQNVNSMQLATVSWVLFVDFLLWLLLFKESLRAGLRSLLSKETIGDIGWIVYALLLGLIVGWGRAKWGLLDVSAVLIFILLMISGLALWRTWSQAMEIETSWMLYFFIIGAFVLGWPVLAVALVFLTFAYLQSHASDFSLAEKYDWLLRFLAGSSLAFLAFQFIRRGGEVDFALTSVIAVFSLFIALYFYCSQRIENASILTTWIVIGAWMSLGAVLALMFKTLLPLAIIALAVALFFVLTKLKSSRSQLSAQLILLSGFLILVLTVLLPKLADPRLLPM